LIDRNTTGRANQIERELRMTTILIVDDEPSIRKYLAVTLGDGGYRVVEAADGVEALEQVHAERPDLVITDIIMPRMNGFEFVRRLRSDPAVARTSVVFITAVFYAEETRTLAQACGVIQLIAKPFKPDEVLRTVGLALSTTAPAPLAPQSETFASEHLGLLTDKITQKMDELHEYSARLQSLSRRLLEVQEAERSRLARELHDELGQVLATVNYQLHALKEFAGPAALPRLEECSATLQRAVEQVRDLSLELRPVLLEALGLEAALCYLAEQHGQRTRQEVQVKCQLAQASLSSEQNIACFRIVQEALANAARHAQANRITVELHHDETALELVIHDDGVGFDVAQAERHALKNKTFGLLGMKERVNLLGGRIDVESAASLGTAIRVRLPRLQPSFSGHG
jgi:signal transduction histidine kinase